MARWSKFEKRMRDRLIDGVEFKLSKRDIPGHERHVILRFVVTYKGENLINYPQREDAMQEDWSYNYGTTTLCAMLLIDKYFAQKHEATFNKTARELFMEAYEEKDQRIDPRYWNPTDNHQHFIKTMAGDLLFILKICDRRTGKRSLRKINQDGIESKFRRIIQDRLVGDSS